MIHYDVSNLPAALLALERDAEKVVAELYWVTWAGAEHWRYTNWHDYLTFDAASWKPTTISRGTVERGIRLQSHRVTIKSLTSVEPFDRFLKYEVPVPVALKILRYFPNGREDSAWCIFNGYITSPRVEGRAIECGCVDKTYLLERDLMRMVYGPCCNWRLGDERCGINLDDYTEPNQTVAAVTGTALTFNVLNGPDGNPAEDDYYTNGFLTYANRRYTIVKHAQAGNGGELTLLFVSADIVTGISVSLTVGCDLKITTCYNKFNNLSKFSGFPFIPLENPGTEIPIADLTDEDIVPTQDVIENYENEGQLIKL